MVSTRNTIKKNENKKEDAEKLEVIENIERNLKEIKKSQADLLHVVLNENGDTFGQCIYKVLVDNVL